MWLDAYISFITKETKYTWRFGISVSNSEFFSYIAGQFIQIKVNNLVRSYSIASMPSRTNIFELIIVRLKGGIMSKYLFENVKKNHKIQIKGPLGKFILPSLIDRDIFFICTGTGIAPFRSMLLHIEKNKKEYRKIFLIFGTRKKSDLLYFNEMIDYSSRMKNIKYLPTLSREKWERDNGYVHEIYKKILRENEYSNEPLFYLCGWRNMIKEARVNLKNLGINSKSIKLEIYG